MKPQFSLYRRNGIYYAQDIQNGKQESLCTRDEAARTSSVAVQTFAASAGPPFNPPSRPSATAAGFFVGFDFIAMIQSCHGIGDGRSLIYGISTTR